MVGSLRTGRALPRTKLFDAIPGGGYLRQGFCGLLPVGSVG
jgi:hypothetical protein